MAGLSIFFIVITKTQAYQYFLVHCLALLGINDLNVADGILALLKIGALSLALLYGSRYVDFTGFSLLFSDFFGVKRS
jgi:hypothetical protein